MSLMQIVFSCVLQILVNPQTTLLCSMLDITDPNAVHLGVASHGSPNVSTTNPDEISVESDDTDGVDDDERPSDISSSFDVSYVNSSMDMSDSFSASKRKSFGSSFSGATSTPKKGEAVEDDDEEFKAILAAQRQKSLGVSSSTESPSKTEGEDSARGSESNGTGSSASQEAGAEEDELASILAAQRVKAQGDSSAAEDMDQTGTTDSGTDDKSEQLDSSSQGSHSGDVGCEGVTSSVTGSPVVELSASSTDTDSVTGGKRPSPLSASDSTSGKKLKRRNVSIYSADEGSS